MTLRNISVSEPPIDDADFNLLEWWKHREARWPELAKMVKQYLAVPARPRRWASSASLGRWPVAACTPTCAC